MKKMLQKNASAFTNRNHSIQEVKEFPNMYQTEIDKGVRKYLASKRPINMSRSKQVHLLMKDFYNTGKEHALDY